MELLTVAVIISVIAAFAIPNYDKSVQNAYAKNAATILRAMDAAQKIYRSEIGHYFPVASGVAESDIADINAGLHLNIVLDEMEYSCTRASEYTCTAYHPTIANRIWAIRIGSAVGGPSCYLGTCPPIP